MPDLRLGDDSPGEDRGIVIRRGTEEHQQWERWLADADVQAPMLTPEQEAAPRPPETQEADPAKKRRPGGRRSE